MKTMIINLFCAVIAILLISGCQPKLAESPYGAREQGWEEFIKNTYPDWEPPHTVPPEKGNIVAPRDDTPIIISDTEVIVDVVDPTIDANAAKRDIEAAETNVSTEFQTYTVQKGDTLWKISRQFYGSGKDWRKIFQANQDTISNPDKIKSGIEIRITAAQYLSIRVLGVSSCLKKHFILILSRLLSPCLQITSKTISIKLKFVFW